MVVSSPASGRRSNEAASGRLQLVWHPDFGAAGRHRTGDLCFTGALLCHLSYRSIMATVARIELATFPVTGECSPTELNGRKMERVARVELACSGWKPDA